MATEKTLPDFDALWDYEQPAKTEVAFRALLSQAEASGNPSYYIELLTQIARTQGLQRDFAAAAQHFAHGANADPPSARFLARAQGLARHPPGPDWQAVNSSLCAS